MAVAEPVHEAANLRLDGILAHDPHFAFDAESEADLTTLCESAMADVERTIEEAASRGIEIDEVVSGSTATAHAMAEQAPVTQLDPGRYLFNDGGQVELGRVDRAECALTVLTTVVSKPAADRVCVDAGFKSIGLDVGSLLPIPKTRDDVAYTHGYSNHAMVDTSEAESAVEVGDTLEFVVPDAHATIDSNDVLVGTRDETVERIWNVQARGKNR